MLQHHLALLLFLLPSTALGAVMPLLRPHDQLQLAGETALKVRDLNPLEARDKKKRKLDSLEARHKKKRRQRRSRRSAVAPGLPPSEADPNPPRFDFGDYRELRSEVVDLYPPNSGFIIISPGDPDERHEPNETNNEHNEPHCLELVSVAMIMKKAIIDAEQLITQQYNSEYLTPERLVAAEQLMAEQLNAKQLKTVPVSRYLPVGLQEGTGILIDGPYEIKQHYVFSSDIVESSNPRMQWVFTFNVAHTKLLMDDLGLTAAFPSLSQQALVTNCNERTGLTPPWFPARIKTTHSADPEWAFILRKSLKGEDKYLAAILGLHNDSDYISANDYLPGSRPGPYLTQATCEQIKTIRKKPYGFRYRLVTMDQLEWPEIGSVDDFTIPYIKARSLKHTLIEKYGDEPDLHL